MTASPAAKNGEVAMWLDRIERAEKKLHPWREESRQIVKRFRDEAGKKAGRLNLHWSNVQLFLSTVFARTPKPEVSRRFGGTPDILAQQLSEVLEKALSFSVDQYDFDAIVETVLVDYANTGLGMARVRYKPSFSPVAPELVPLGVAEDINGAGEIVLKYYDGEGRPVDPEEAPKIQAPDGSEIPAEEVYQRDENGDEIRETLAYEEVCVEFVPWDNFGWNTDARTWPDVDWTYIKHRMTKHEAKREFGRKANEIEYGAQDGENQGLIIEAVDVYEVFDKTSRRVLCVCKGYDGFLLNKDDPYKLEGFFPHPMPLLGTVTSDKLIPVPLFKITADLYNELDEIQSRIIYLIRAMKVRGFYDATYQEAFQDLLGSEENTMVPISTWAKLAETGGLKNIVQFMELGEIVAALNTLVSQRESLIQKIYEITGFSDVARGGGRASTSAAQDKIKNEYLSIRINREVKKVSRFVRDIFRLMAEMISEHFGVETLQTITGVPIDQGVFQMLRSDRLRSYKVDVETDSMLVDDESAEVARRAETTNAISTLFQSIAPLVQQGNIPPDAAKALLLWNVSATARGRQVERILQDMVFLPPAPPPPDPAAGGMVPGEDGDAGGLPPGGGDQPMGP